MDKHRQLALLRREAWRIVKDRALMMSFATQLFTIMVATTLISGIAFSSAGNVQEAQGVPVEVSGVGEAGDFLEARLREIGMSVVRVSSDERPSRVHNLNTGASIKVEGESLTGNEAIRVDVRITQSFNSASVTRAIRLTLEELQNAAREARLVEIKAWNRESFYADIKGNNPVADSSHVYSVFEMTYTALLPLILIMPAVIAGGLLSEGVIEEKERKTFLLLSTAPFTRLEIYNARVMVYTLVAIFQVMVSVAILILFGIAFAEIGYLFLVAGVLSLDFCVLGCLVASLSSTKSSAQLAYSVSTASLLMAGFVLPGSAVNLLAKLASTPHSGIFGIALLPLLAGIPLYLAVMSRARSEEE